MATLRQAIERQREAGKLPQSAVISIRNLHQTFHPTPSNSTRALISKMFEGVSKKMPWAVILCRFKGEAPNPTLEAPIEQFYRDIFTPGTLGLFEYWRDASLGAIEITGSKVFGWVELEIPREKAGGSSKTSPVGPGRVGLNNFAVKAVQRNGGDPIKGFQGQIAIYTQNWSKDGVTQDGAWKDWSPFWLDGSASENKVTLTPPHDGNITAHEMGHGFGMNHDVDSDLDTDYMDPCCIMSQNGGFNHPTWNRNFGPAICLPHLMQKDWMYKRRVYIDSGDWMLQPDGITLPLAPIIRPHARANLGIKLPFKRGDASWEYYLEYVIAAEWNRGLPGAPYLFIRRMAPKYGGTPAYLGSIPIPAAIGKTAQFVEPSGNVRFQAELTNLPGPIIKVKAKKL